MSLIETTLVASVGLLPGTTALGIAMGPRGRAMRKPRFAPRLVGTLIFSCLVWSIWMTWGHSHSSDLARLLIGSESEQVAVMKGVLSMRGDAPKLVLLLAVVTVGIGLLGAAAHHCALRGLAICDYDTAPKEGLRSQCVHWLLRGLWRAMQFFQLDHLIRPTGAAYAVVIRCALEQQHGAKNVLLYADVLQGSHEDSATRKHGTLYTGQLDHIVCDDSGCVATVVLRDAQRLARGKDVVNFRGEPVAPPVDGGDPSELPLGFKQISNNEGFVINGADIRNVSFRPMLKGEGADKGELLDAFTQAIALLNKVSKGSFPKDDPPPTQNQATASRKPPPSIRPPSRKRKRRGP